MKTKLFICIAVFFSMTTLGQSGVDLEVNMLTGSDDLRSGNHAFLSINFKDNTSSRKYDLGDGFGQNSNVNRKITLDYSTTISNIRSFTITHDGSPKNVFESYDNWDLQSLEIQLRDEENGGNPVGVYNSANDPRRKRFVTRFTGDSRLINVYNQYRSVR
jgi:hypothetical protein